MSKGAESSHTWTMVMNNGFSSLMFKFSPLYRSPLTKELRNGLPLEQYTVQCGFYHLLSILFLLSVCIHSTAVSVGNSLSSLHWSIYRPQFFQIHSKPLSLIYIFFYILNVIDNVSYYMKKKQNRYSEKLMKWPFY